MINYNNKRKIAAFIDDESHMLLEINGILTIGRDSKFSEWLRGKIHQEFGNKDILKINYKELEAEAKKLEIQKYQNEARWLEIQKRMAETKAIIDRHERNMTKLKENNITDDEYAYLMKIKLELSKTGNTFEMVKLRRDDYNENFNKELDISKFSKLLELIE